MRNWCHFLLLFCACILISNRSIAQFSSADEQLVDVADEAFRFGAKNQARDQYLEALKINPNNLRANYMAGICFVLTIQKERSLKYFLKAYDLDPTYTSELVVDPNLYRDLTFLIGNAYHLGENFDKAELYYKQYKDELQKNRVCAATLADKASAGRFVDRKIYECGVGKEMKANPVLVNIRSLNDLNSPFPDYAPVLDSSLSTMIFTSRRAGGASPDVAEDLYFYEDIYVSDRMGDTSWSKPTLIPELATAKNEACISLSSDGKTLLIYKDENNGDIFISRKGDGDKWSTPKSIDKTINSEYKETSAFITSNGKYMYFASDRPGGFGGFDIYVSEYLGNDKWAIPFNLGPKINTEWDDDVPMLTPDNMRMYFSSKGHRGMGGYDIYKSKFDTARGEWLDPSNVGYPINTADNDIYYFTGQDTMTAYYSSLKDFGVGDIDIFEIKFVPIDNLTADSLRKLQNELMDRLQALSTPDTAIINQNLAELLSQDVYVLDSADVYAMLDKKQEKPMTMDELLQFKREFGYLPGSGGKAVKTVKPTEIAVRIAVIDKKTGKPMSAIVRFSKRGSNEELLPDEIAPGIYELRMPVEMAGDYVVTAEKDGFMFGTVNVKVPKKGGTINTKLFMDEKSLNTPLALRNIYFDFNKATIKAVSQRELKVVLRFLKSNPKTIVEIAGHTDAIGGDEYNQKLSERRANAVANWLMARGIDNNRLIPKGYGKSRPLASNDDEDEGRELNRRTEFELLTDTR